MTPGSYGGSLFWQMSDFRGSPPESVPFRCLQLKTVSTIVGWQSQTPSAPISK